MSNLIPFQFEDRSIRVVTGDDGETLFVGKDICEVLGYANASDAMNDHCKGVAKRYPLQTAGGRQEMRVLTEPDVLRLIVNSKLPAAEKFERWVFEDVLPAIRKTGSYTAPQTPQQNDADKAIAASKVYKPLFQVARLIGLDKNAAAIAANNATVKASGTNLLQLLGHTHLEAENQGVVWLTPTELGARTGMSAQAMNAALAKAGLQEKIGKDWIPNAAYQPHWRKFDTDKKHSNGTAVLQLKWADTVLTILKKEAA